MADQAGPWVISCVVRLASLAQGLAPGFGVKRVSFSRCRGVMSAAHDDLIDLPPRLPTIPAELERAIMLLGCRAKSDLRGPVKLELEQLVGAYPSTSEANRWKRALKAYRDDPRNWLGADEQRAEPKHAAGSGGE